MNPIIHLFLAGFFSVVPMVIYLIIIWWMDRYEREPFWLVSLNFVWGATGAIIFGIIGSIIISGVKMKGDKKPNACAAKW